MNRDRTYLSFWEIPKINQSREGNCRRVKKLRYTGRQLTCQHWQENIFSEESEKLALRPSWRYHCRGCCEKLCLVAFLQINVTQANPHTFLVVMRSALKAQVRDHIRGLIQSCPWHGRHAFFLSLLPFTLLSVELTSMAWWCIAKWMGMFCEIKKCENFNEVSHFISGNFSNFTPVTTRIPCGMLKTARTPLLA